MIILKKIHELTKQKSTKLFIVEQKKHVKGTFSSPVTCITSRKTTMASPLPQTHETPGTRRWLKLSVSSILSSPVTFTHFQCRTLRVSDHTPTTANDSLISQSNPFLFLSQTSHLLPTKSLPLQIPADSGPRTPRASISEENQRRRRLPSWPLARRAVRRRNRRLYAVLAGSAGGRSSRRGWWGFGSGFHGREVWGHGNHQLHSLLQLAGNLYKNPVFFNLFCCNNLFIHFVGQRLNQSWVFAWLDTGNRRYVVYSLVYLVPYIRY